MTDAALLADLLAQLRSSVKGEIEVVASDGESLTLRVGARADARVTLRLVDPSRPTFAVSYQHLSEKRDGTHEIHERIGDGVLAQGVEWIVSQLLEHGVVTSEWYRRHPTSKGQSARRARTAQSKRPRGKGLRERD
jgi:hypothetical protein